MQPPPQDKNEQVLAPVRRWSGLYTVGLVVLLLIFFAVHQRKQTGFFTTKFGLAEMVALYLPILISLAAPILRLIYGRIDPARLVETVSDLCLAVGSIWLWHTFPFNFSHFADLFPEAIRFAFAWLNNNIGRFVLLLQIVLGFISAFSTIVSYLRERNKKIV